MFVPIPPAPPPPLPPCQNSCVKIFFPKMMALESAPLGDD